MDEHAARMKRFEAWLPKWEAQLAENRRRMKMYCAMAKLRNLLKQPEVQRKGDGS